MNRGTATGSRSMVDSRPWGGAAAPGSGDHCDSSEREEVIGVLTNDVTWRWSCENGQTTSLNRGGRWCSDGEMVSGVRRKDWSRGGCDG
jgi:hypothetical protein